METTTQKRFRDNQEHLGIFADEFLVVCPRCQKCARVIALGALGNTRLRPHRLLCSFCAYYKDTEATYSQQRPDQDWYFGCPLWLSIECADGHIWAFNYQHLAWLEHYVRATLRERRPDKWGWSSWSAVNRLPTWIKSAKNWRAILHGIARIKRNALTT